MLLKGQIRPAPLLHLHGPQYSYCQPYSSAIFPLPLPHVVSHLGLQLLKYKLSLLEPFGVQTPTLSTSTHLCLTSQGPDLHQGGDRTSFLPVYFLLLLTAK